MFLALAGAIASGTALFPVAPATAAIVPVHVYTGQSIPAALIKAGSAGVVVVHSGTYPALAFGPYSWAVAPTLKGAPGEPEPVIDGATLDRVVNLSVSGVRSPKPVTVTGGRGVAITGSDLVGVTVKNGASGVRIVDDDIVGGWNGVAVTSWSGASRPTDVRITGNRISGQTNDNIQIGIADDVVVEDNVLRDPVANDNHNDGVQFMGGERLVIRRNRISGQDQAILLQVEPSLGAGNRVGGARVENNIISATRGAGIITSATVGTVIANNTIYDTPYASVNVAPGNTTLQVFNNVLRQLWVEKGAAAPTFEDHNCVAVGGRGTSDVTTSPQFVDRTSYRLASISPCVNLGLRSGAPTTDFAKAPRGLLPDAGAWEVVP